MQVPGESISPKKAKQECKALRDERPDLKPKLELPKAVYFDQTAINAVMSVRGAVGVRIYLGVTEKKALNLMLVAVDAKGNDILPDEGTEPRSIRSAAKSAGDDDPIIVNHGSTCPTDCGEDNYLNV